MQNLTGNINEREFYYEADVSQGFRSKLEQEIILYQEDI